MIVAIRPPTASDATRSSATGSRAEHAAAHAHSWRITSVPPPPAQVARSRTDGTPDMQATSGAPAPPAASGRARRHRPTGSNLGPTGHTRLRNMRRSHRHDRRRKAARSSGGDRPSGPRSGCHDERRGQLLGSASEVFVDRGYHATRHGRNRRSRRRQQTGSLYRTFKQLKLYLAAVLQQRRQPRVGSASSATNHHRQPVSDRGRQAFFDFIEHDGQGYRLIFRNDNVTTPGRPR